MLLNQIDFLQSRPNFVPGNLSSVGSVFLFVLMFVYDHVQYFSIVLKLTSVSIKTWVSDFEILQYSTLFKVAHETVASEHSSSNGSYNKI